MTRGGGSPASCTWETVACCGFAMSKRTTPGKTKRCPQKGSGARACLCCAIFFFVCLRRAVVCEVRSLSFGVWTGGFLCRCGGASFLGGTALRKAGYLGSTSVPRWGWIGNDREGLRVNATERERRKSGYGFNSLPNTESVAVAFIWTPKVGGSGSDLRHISPSLFFFPFFSSQLRGPLFPPLPSPSSSLRLHASHLEVFVFSFPPYCILLLRCLL